MATYNSYPSQPRNKQMPGYVNYPPQGYAYQSQQDAPIGLKGRFVASFDEVKASPVDFDGSVSYFPDAANKRIYTKQIGADGTPIYGLYEKRVIEESSATNNNYITRDEFNTAINNLRFMWMAPQPNTGAVTGQPPAQPITSVETNVVKQELKPF